MVFVSAKAPGAVTARFQLERPGGIMRLRGKWLGYNGTPGGKAMLLVRLRSRVACDVDLDIRPLRGNKESRHTIPFAHGLFPAYVQPEHQVFLLELPGGFPERIAVELIRRPESGPASTPR